MGEGIGAVVQGEAAGQPDKTAANVAIGHVGGIDDDGHGAVLLIEVYLEGTLLAGRVDAEHGAGREESGGMTLNAVGLRLPPAEGVLTTSANEGHVWLGGGVAQSQMAVVLLGKVEGVAGVTGVDGVAIVVLLDAVGGSEERQVEVVDACHEVVGQGGVEPRSQQLFFGRGQLACHLGILVGRHVYVVVDHEVSAAVAQIVVDDVARSLRECAYEAACVQ